MGAPGSVLLQGVCLQPCAPGSPRMGPVLEQGGLAGRCSAGMGCGEHRGLRAAQLLSLPLFPQMIQTSRTLIESAYAVHSKLIQAQQAGGSGGAECTVLCAACCASERPGMLSPQGSSQKSTRLRSCAQQCAGISVCALHTCSAWQRTSGAGIGALGQHLAGSGERLFGAAQGSALWLSHFLALLRGVVQGAARSLQ